MSSGFDGREARNRNPISQSSPLLEKAWRTVSAGDREDHLEYVRDFKVPSGIKHVRVLLHGPQGSGKSSFINSVDTVLKGRTAVRAGMARSSARSFTNTFKTYNFPKEGRYYPFVFNDSMGIDRAAKKGVSVEDIKLVLRGHVKEGYKFKPEHNLLESHANYVCKPKLDDKVHVLALIVDANTVDMMDDEAIKKMDEIRLAARDLGIPQIAILTKIDETCEEVKDNVGNAYKSKDLEKKVDQLSVRTGIPINCIFLVKNYHLEINTNAKTDVLILSVLRKILDFGEDFVKDNQPESSFCALL